MFFKQAVDRSEGAGVVFDANASDLDGSPIIYGLTNPLTNGQSFDNAHFTINSATGRFIRRSFDFENLPNQMKTIPQQSSTFYGTPLTPSEIESTFVIEVNATDDATTPTKSDISCF